MRLSAEAMLNGHGYEAIAPFTLHIFKAGYSALPSIIKLQKWNGGTGLSMPRIVFLYELSQKLHSNM